MLKKYAKALIAVTLSFSIAVSGISPLMIQALAAPVITAEEPQSGVTTLTEDEHIKEDCYISGTVNGDRHSIYVDSGKLTIEQSAVVNADIILNGKALLEVDGTVNGLITVLSTNSPDARIDWDGTLARPNNLVINNSASIRELLLDNPRGFGGITGYVGKITYTENYGGEIVLWGGGSVDEIIYNADTEIYCDGNVGELKITAGNFGINDAANIEKVIISGSGNTWINGRVNLLVFRSANWFNVNDNAQVDTIILDCPTDEGGFNNQSTVKNLIVNKGSVNNGSYIENVYLNNCSYFNSNMGDGTSVKPYIIKNLVSRSCKDLNLSGTADGSRKYGNIDINGVDGGSIRMWDMIADSVSITGICDYVEITNFLAQYVYLDAEALNNSDFLHMPNPKTVTALNLTVSQEFYDANSDFIRDMIGKSPEKGVSIEEWTDMFLKVEERLKLAPVDTPQSVTLNMGETVRVNFTSRDSLGLVQIYAPSGDPVFTLASSVEDATGNFVAEEKGNYKIEVYGAKYGGSVNVQVITPNKVELNTYTRNSCGVGEEPVINNVSVSSFTYSLFDETDGKAIYNYILKGNTLLLMPEQIGHSVTLTARHYSQGWGNYYGYADGKVTFTAGSESSVDISCVGYGAYDAWIEDATDVRAYLYNDDSEYVCTLNNDGGGYWSEPMPEGEYSVVFIRDPGGQFRFRKLTDYRRYGLREGSAYTAVTFYNRNGIRFFSHNLYVPPAPELEWPHLVKDMTSFSAPVLTGAMGTLFDMDLRFQFEDPSVVSDVTAKIVFSKDCVIMGNDGDSAEDNELTVPFTPEQTRGTFTVTSKNADTTLTAYATLAYTVGSEQYETMIGTINISVVTISCNAQTATDDGIITVFGNATPNQPVTVFDGNTQIAVVTAGANGYWSANVQLAEQAEGYHSISAAVNAYSPQEIKTEPVKVYYAPYMPKLQKVIFEYQVHGHADHIELTGEEWSGARWRYDYWPDAIFTFQVQLTNSNYIKDMYVASTTDGSYYSIPGAYDEKSGLWIASGQFCEDQSYMPGKFIIGYTLKDVTASLTSEDYIEVLRQQISLPTDSKPVTITDSEMSDIMSKAQTEIVDTQMNEDGSQQMNNVKVSLDGYESNFIWIQEVIPPEKSYQEYINEGYTVVPDTNVLIKVVTDSDTGIMQLLYVVFDLDSVASEKTGKSDGVKISLLSTTNLSIDSSQSNGNHIMQLSSMNGVAGNVRENIYQAGVIVLGFPDLPYDGDVGGWTLDKAIDFVDKYTGGIPGLIDHIYNSLKDESEIMKKVLAQFTSDRANMEANVDGLKKLKQLADTYQCSCDNCSGKCNCSQLIAQMKTTSNNALAMATETLKQMNNVKGVSDFTLITVTADRILAGYFLARICDKIEKSNKAKKIDPKKGEGVDPEELKGFGSEVIEGVAKYAINDSINQLLSISEQKRLRTQDIFDQALNDVQALQDKINDCQCEPTPTPTPSPSPTNKPTNTATPTNRSEPSSSPEDPQDPNGPGGGDFGSDPDVGNDPSGYVFEAVESNRLENVTTTVYFQDTDGTASLWDAAASGQVNPQITGSNGRYQWFVPSGFWRVEYAKTGYEPYTTQWMRVPPPRVDVNIPLHSSRVAQVVTAAVMTDYAEVSFDKYLDVDTIAGLITVNGLSAELQPVNAEKSGLGDGKTYASVFRAMFSDGKAVAGKEYTVTVSPTAKCYAGINNASFEQTVKALPTITEISAETPDYFASGKEITITVKLNADSSTDGVKLKAVSSNPSLAEVVSVSEPEYDTVYIKLNTAKAGAATLTLSVIGTAQAASIPIVVARSTDTKLIAAATGWLGTNSFNYDTLIIILASIVALGAGALIVIFMVRKRRSKIGQNVK